MDGLDFIKIYETLEEAYFIKKSPHDTIISRTEIQLLPNNPSPYIQRTSNPNSVEIEDWNCYLVHACSGSKEDITAYFEVDYVFFDDNGTNQIQWRLTNLPTDYNRDYVYLEIDQGVGGQTYYSTPFLLTNSGSEFTSRFDYGCELNKDVQSIQLNIYFRQDFIDTELATYNEISTNTTVTTTTQSSEYQKFVTGVFSIDRLILFSKIFSEIYTFCNLQRVNLYNPIEIPEVNGNVNSVIQSPILLSFESLIYDPFHIEPEPKGDYSGIDYNSNDYNT